MLCCKFFILYMRSMYKKNICIYLLFIWIYMHNMILKTLSFLRHFVHWKAYTIIFWQMWKDILGFELRSARIVCIKLILKRYIFITKWIEFHVIHKWFTGLFLVTDKQTPIPSQMAIFTWMMHNVLKRMKNQFSDF